MTQKRESSITFLQQAMYSPSPPSHSQLPDGIDEQTIDLYQDMLSLRSFIKALGEGNLSAKLPIKGYLAGILKAQQANLRHMTWQTQRIAEGDFNQHIDFLGDFSTAFNKMTVQLKEARQALSKSEAHYRKLTETMLDVICTIDRKTWRASFFSPSIMRLAGYTPEEAMNMPLRDLFSKKSARHISRIIEKHLSNFTEGKRKTDDSCTLEAQLKKKDNALVWTEIIVHFIWDTHTEDVFMNAVIRDITKRKQMQDKLEIQASMDDLTGIANRRYFLSCAEKQIHQSQTSGAPMCFLMMDIDHFKKVNDTYGHSVGDTMLQIVSSTCQQALRSTDKIGRLGGEEFGVFMPDTDIAQGTNVAERIRKKVEQEARVTYCGAEIQTTISIGIAELYADKDTLHSILIRADNALYTAKSNGRNQISHSSEMVEINECPSPWGIPGNNEAESETP